MLKNSSKLSAIILGMVVILFQYIYQVILFLSLLLLGEFHLKNSDGSKGLEAAA